MESQKTRIVHWKEYENKHDQWIVKIRLLHTREVIEDYWTNILRQNLQKRRVKLKINISKQNKQLRNPNLDLFFFQINNLLHGAHRQTMIATL